MELTLYLNQSEPNAVSKNLSEVIKLQGTLREGCSITDPIILIAASALPSNALVGINYARIEEFGRYYYITDITTERNGAWRFTMHVDVLMTGEARLRQLSAIIRRQENINVANLYLTDDTYKAEQKRKVQTLKMTSSTGGFTKDGNYIATVFGTHNTTGGE